MPGWTRNRAEYERAQRILTGAPLTEDVIIFLNDGTVVRGLLEGSGIELDVANRPGADARMRGFFRVILDSGDTCEIDVLDVLRVRPRPDK